MSIWSLFVKFLFFGVYTTCFSNQWLDPFLNHLLSTRWNYWKYSSNEIRKTKNEHLIIFWQNSIGLIFLVFAPLGFLSRNYHHHPLMAIIWEKVSSILAKNLNSGLTYLITLFSFPSTQLISRSVWDRKRDYCSCCQKVCYAQTSQIWEVSNF